MSQIVPDLLDVLDLAAEEAGGLVAALGSAVSGRVMQDGRIVADGNPDALLAGPHIPSVFGIEKVDGAWRPVTA